MPTKYAGNDSDVRWLRVFIACVMAEMPGKYIIMPSCARHTLKQHMPMSRALLKGVISVALRSIKSDVVCSVY